ncbi:MAG: class I SAM-dependent methyltransferase [Syntrophaceae bacterium]|nr:class I SAM-dependent methyltransferase [Syntrophaceae bacterium]
MKYYNAYEERYRAVHQMGLSWEINEPTPEITQWIKYLGGDFPDPVLDVGCGEGRDARFLSEKGFKIVGIDISSEAISWCRERIPRARFNFWDIVDQPYFVAFKRVYSIGTLHMLVKSCDRMAFLKNIFHSMVNGGEFLLVVMGDGIFERSTDADDAYSIVERVHQETGALLKVASTSCKIVNREDLIREVEAAGFIVDEFLLTRNNSHGQCMTLYLRKET